MLNMPKYALVKNLPNCAFASNCIMSLMFCSEHDVIGGGSFSNEKTKNEKGEVLMHNKFVDVVPTCLIGMKFVRAP